MSVAIKARDYTRCIALLDEFIATAEGEDLGVALALKAGVFIHVGDQTKLVAGLALIDEALKQIHTSDYLLHAAVNGLSLCNMLHDPVLGERYAAIGYTLLRHDPTEQETWAHRPGLQMTLGRWAELRGDLIQAYWHFNQALMDFERGQFANCMDQSAGLFWANMHVSRVCQAMDRPVEAMDALEVAAKHVFSENAKRKWDSLHEALQASNTFRWAEAK